MSLPGSRQTITKLAFGSSIELDLIKFYLLNSAMLRALGSQSLQPLGSFASVALPTTWSTFTWWIVTSSFSSQVIKLFCDFFLFQILPPLIPLASLSLFLFRGQLSHHKKVKMKTWTRLPAANRIDQSYCHPLHPMYKVKTIIILTLLSIHHSSNWTP